jgi:hypothetical protein
MGRRRAWSAGTATSGFTPSSSVLVTGSIAMQNGMLALKWSVIR